MASFFISRPIFSTVMAMVFIVAGGVCMTQLPIALYPQIVPPQVQVTSQYTGASAEVVADSVTTPIEEQINGTEGMIYMSSVSDNNGNSTITVTFDVGYNLSIAAVDVMNNVEIAKSQVPEMVNRTGIKVQKQSPDITLVVNLVSPDGSRDSAYLSNYADINICDVLRRLPGVGFVNIFGERKYSLRIWLDPAKLSSLGITGNDVSTAIRNQNLQVAAGKIGGPPTRENQMLQYQINTLGRLSQIEQFEDIILRTRPDGSVVRIKAVGSVELGAENYDTSCGLNNKPSIAVAVYQLPGANALDVADGVYKEMEHLSERFPEGVEYKIVYDTTAYVNASIDEVVETLFIAIILVFCVVYVFLQSWHATLIAAITIPVSLIGTFALMTVLGFSINTLSLLGLVLAIGLVVDDAIVVVENVQRQLELGVKDTREAARLAMREVTSPIIATTLVLMAVFVPVAFMPGIVGQLYNQFALTIACSVGISAINSLSLSPALCGVLLKPEGAEPAEGGKLGWWQHIRRSKWIAWFDWARWFNTAFGWITHHYERAVRRCVAWWPAVLVAFAILIAGTLWLFQTVPGGFLPEEDQGYVVALVQTPTGTAIGQTEKAASQMIEMGLKIPGMADAMSIPGYSLVDNAKQSSAATIFFVLKPWDERKSKELHAAAIMDKLREMGSTIGNARVLVFNAPPIQGLATTGGFQFELQDLHNAGPKELDKVAQRLIEAGNKRPELTGLSTTFSTDVPQLYLDIDRTKVKSMNVPMGELFKTLEIQLGSYYVNQFNKYGRIYRVYLQAHSSARDNVD
ncbi:MAG: efflux RND transporter permease subunit, partial [Planctomycetota bacterium]|nr:efflux RND transporter permease subunit [Planctomycetota bacterium]